MTKTCPACGILVEPMREFCQACGCPAPSPTYRVGWPTAEAPRSRPARAPVVTGPPWSSVALAVVALSAVLGAVLGGISLVA